MKISYAVTVCNEHKELERLLSFLIKNVRDTDEIIVQGDKDNTTLEVLSVLNKYSDRVISIEYPLNGHFADFKNNLTEKCTGDYIYQIDADEMINEYILRLLPQVLEQNDVDVLLVPRINTVTGLTQQHVVKWKNKVHEVLDGYKTMSHLPTEKEWCLIHEKTITRQEQQNNYYNTLQ